MLFQVMPTCVPTYGMAPEPKLVSLPRGPGAHPSTSSGVGGGGGARARSDSAASTHSQHDKDAPPKLTSVQSSVKAVEKEKPSTSNGPQKLSKLEDELDRMPALLAPCTRGIISQEKLSPPLPGSHRADVLDQQGPSKWDHSSRSGNRDKPRELITVKRTAVKSKPTKTLPNKAKVKKGSAAQQTKLKIKGKYQKKKQKAFKHEIDFEPPCKRTRLAERTGNIAEHALSTKVCKCARLNPPSRLTCFGQRCPCYSNQLPCISCMCRGCRNPRKETGLLRNGDDDRSDGEHDPPMPRLSPEPRT